MLNQVRTVLQDAWALIRYHLICKDEASIPQRIRRDLNNVATLLEIAQGIFDLVRDKRDRYLAEIRNREEVVPDLLSQPIDYDTLVVYTEWKFPGLPVSEYWHARLLADLNRKRYQTLQDIDQTVQQAKKAVGAYKEENPVWFKFGTDYTKSLGFIDEEFRRIYPWGDKTKDAFKRWSTWSRKRGRERRKPNNRLKHHADNHREVQADRWAEGII